MVKKHIKRPRDLIQLAKLIGDIATHQIEDKIEDGKNYSSVKFGQEGGEVRANKLTPERRKEIAKKAAQKRWQKK